MSKADFFNQLRERLRGLPHEEKQHIIRIYEDLFRQAEESGKSEREIIESLGFVPVPMIPSPQPGCPLRRTDSCIRIVLASVALGLFNLMFVLGPFLAFSGVLFSLSVVSIVLLSSPIWILFGTGIPDSLNILLLEVFSALMFTGLGVLLGIGMWKAGIGYGKLVKRYVMLNMKLIKGD